MTSSASATSLTVSDRSATATGHLVNGTEALPQALQVSSGGPFAPIGGATQPTLLQSWSGPLANDLVTLQFKQPVAATDRMKAGRYGKTVTFTLASTHSVASRPQVPSPRFAAGTGVRPFRGTPPRRRA